MKVYVVTSGQYSDYHIDAVCIDKDIADTIAHSIEENGYDVDAYVEEYDTDDFSAKSAKIWTFGCMIDKKKPVFLNPDTLRYYWDEVTFDRSKRSTPMELADKVESEEGNMVNIFVFTAPEDSLDKAQKIAQDLVAQANYILVERDRI